MRELTLPANNSLTSHLSATFSTEEPDESGTLFSMLCRSALKKKKEERMAAYFVLGFGAEVFRLLPATCRQVQDGGGGHVSSLGIVGVVVGRALSVTVESEAG